MNPLYILAALPLLAACTTTSQPPVPLIDTAGKDLAAYHVDLGECQQYAHTQATASEGAAAGIAAGAIFGTIVMALMTDSSDYLSQGAATGAFAGGVRGAADASQNRRDIVARCMTGRGYTVLSY